MNQIEIIFGVLLLSGMAFGFIKAAGQRKELQSKLDAAEKELQDLRINEDLDISEKVAELAGQIIKNASYKNEISIKDEDGEKIQQINEFLNNILNSPTNISIISTDLDRKVIFWNKGAERMLGYTAEEMVGKKDIEILYANEITKQVIASHIQSIVKDGTGLIAEVEEKTKSVIPLFKI